MERTTFQFLFVVIALCAILHVQGQPCMAPNSTFVVTSDATGFNVTLEGLQLLRHSADNPMLYVGRGQNNILEFSGNFFVNKYTQERVALTNYSIEQPSGGEYTITLSSCDFWVKLRLSSSDKTPLVMEITGSSNNFNRVWLRVPATRDEHVYGGGEQFSYLDLRGRVYPVWTREQGVGRNKSTMITFFADQIGKAGGDYYTTYFPQPTWLTSRNYFLHYTGSNYAELDFRAPDFFEMYIEGPPSSWHFQVQSSMSDLVSCLTDFFGRMNPLPTWLYDGAIVGVQGGTEVMLNRLKQARDANMSVVGLWIQDWSGTMVTPFGKRVFWNWRWDPKLYPDLNTTIQTLKQSGVRVLGYINPSLDSRGDLFQTAQQGGYLVRNSTNDTYLVFYGTYQCGMVDFTNPDAYNWYKNDVIKTNMIHLGLGGWMADFGEYLPVDSVLYSGDDPTLMHNQWPRLWAKLNHEAVQEMGDAGKDIVFFSRSGFSGMSNATMLMWAGDQNVDFSISDGAASTIPAALSMGLSGVGLTHFDIGGYTTYVLEKPIKYNMIRSAERLLRSAEHAVFGPVFRTHEGNIPQANVQFYSSPYVLACFKRLVDMFTLLKPYHLTVVNTTSTTGIPAQRPLFLSYPNDTQTYISSMAYQYLYGDDLLVAPVYLPSQDTSRVYLPGDTGVTWVFLWNATMTSSGGRYVTVPCPLGMPPVFYRSDSTFTDIFQKIGKKMPIPPPPFPPKPTTHRNDVITSDSAITSTSSISTADPSGGGSGKARSSILLIQILAMMFHQL